MYRGGRAGIARRLSMIIQTTCPLRETPIPRIPYQPAVLAHLAYDILSIRR